MTACSKTTGSGTRLHQKPATGSGRRPHQKSATGSGRDRCHSGGFLLRIMPPSWHPVPACAPRLCCRRAIRCSNDGAAAIPKFEPEIQNHCTMEGISGQISRSDSQVYPLKSRITARWRAFPVENLQRFPSLPHQIKNRCTQERVNGEILR